MRKPSFIASFAAGISFIIFLGPPVHGEQSINAGRKSSASLQARDLRARMGEIQEKIDSLSVVYWCKYADVPNRPTGAYLYRALSAKAPYSLLHVSGHGNDRLSWRDDPALQVAYVTSHHLYNEFPVNRTYFGYNIRPEEELPGTLKGEFYFIATGVWPLTGRQPARIEGRPYALREVAKEANYSTVRPILERLDGRWCHVLEWPGHDRLWLDADRGCVLLARETFKANAMAQRFELGGYREVFPDIWLPSWIRNTQYDYTASIEIERRRVVINALVLVLRSDVNCVSDSVFEYKPPPGALLIQSDYSMIQTEPGGFDHLDRMARLIETTATRRGMVPKAMSIHPALYLLPAALFISVGEIHRRSSARRARFTVVDSQP